MIPMDIGDGHHPVFACLAVQHVRISIAIASLHVVLQLQCVSSCDETTLF
jgi:hypothetical protein